MLPYQAVAMDYAVTSSFQRQSPAGVAGAAAAAAALNMNPAFTHSCILELRKEKSRDAARSRRGKENFEFYELAKMLPLPAAITSQLDKASIIRLTISYLKLRDFSGHGDPPWSRDGPPPNKSVKGGPVRPRSVAGIAMEMFEQHQGTHILQSLDGFAFALAADGRFLYISETVSIYLGLSQVEMTGSSVFDYIHHQDHAEVAEQLGLGLAQGQNLSSPNSAGSEEGVNSTTGTNNPDVATLMCLNSNSAYKGLDRAFCVRMKSTLTKRGCHFKSSGYRVVLVLCRLRPQYTFSHTRKSSPPLLGMVAIAMALPPPSVHEIRLESDMFVTRINFDFRIAHCEPRVSELLDYSAEELTGKNLYALCHGEDANKLRKSHVDLINKGQVMTQYYRVMNKNGGYTWVQTCATVVCNSKNAEEQNIICVNYVISGREYENLIMDCCQLEDSVQTVKREETGGNDPENGSPGADRGGRSSGGPPNQQQDPHRSPPDLDDGSSEGPGDQHGGRGGRGHLDHVTQLQGSAAQMTSQAVAANVDHTHLAGGLSIRALKKITSIEKDLSASRRAQKRKLTQQEEDSSCCSSDEDDDEDDEPSTGRGGKTLLHHQAHRSTVLSPASSSCHSSTTSSCVPAAPPGIASSSGGGLVITAEPNCVSPKPSVQHDDTDGGGGGTSVKDLEHAMSKHLPSVSLGKGATASSPPLSLQHQPTDFSTDALLKQQQQRSTIQWIGAHHHHLNHLNHHQQLQHSQGSSAPLPASALLRQLYANRESVIRANVHAATSGMPSSTGRGGTSYYAGDVNQVGPLPTPPGSEGSSTYGDHQFVLSHNQKSGAGLVNGGADAFSSLVSSYSTTGYSVDYHSAMTPPSSVSPRDKHQQQLHSGGAFDSPAYSDVLRHQYLSGGGGGTDGTPAQPLPLKPQVYSAMHPSALDAAAAYAATTSLDQSQFYHHSAAGAGFHLYHPATNKTVTATATVYPEALKNSANWYSTAS
ncbi:protein trachealess isoform X2 [Zootermopsis nevadensis]|uniref:protein trachealess isoform X2 n=1 Tax=Zootermopsis nevadensis TaxID=136037 RepID=UPI000B8E75CE|nr:protein trachealess isoform X2 [Zootermopsis nevadensis]